MDKQTNNRYLKLIAIASSLIVLFLMMLMLKALKVVFIPLALSIFISFLYAPLNRILLKIRFHVVLRILLLILILFIITYLVVALGFTGLTRFISEFPSYQPRFVEMITNIGENLRIPDDQVEYFIESQLSLFNIISSFSINRIVAFIANNLIAIFGYYILILFFSVFFLTDDKHFILKLFQLFVPDKEKSELIMRKIEKQLNVYIISKTSINLLASSTSAFAVSMIGVDFPILSGFLIFTFGYIPEIGSVIAALFPILFCFLKFGLSWQLFATITSLLLINSTMGNYLEPKLMGHQFNISPILIIVVLILWGWVWGPIGMILAVPITVVMNVIIKEMDKFKGVRSILEVK